MIKNKTHCIIFVFLILFMHSFTGLAQSFTLAPTTRITDLVDKYKNANFSKSTWNGWRIQLVATTERTKMENALGRWRALYPSFEPQWFHSAPYYIVRVGAFTNRLEAIQFLQRVKKDFKGAYPAKDKAIPREEFFMDY